MEDFNSVSPISPDPLRQNSSTNNPSSDNFSSSASSEKDKTISGPIMPMGGPQFSPMESNGWGSKAKRWFGKYGDSIILPLIAVLILAGGIYLYATRISEEADVSKETSVKTTGEGLALSEINLEAEEEIISPISEKTTKEISPEIVLSEKNTAQEPKTEVIEKIIPEPVKEGGKIIEKATKGDGVTHLARRALKNYLADHPQDKDMRNEYKIYIEDYLKDRIGLRQLEVGEEVSFEENIIQEAIDASLGLDEGQLKNLKKYSIVVSWQ